MDTDKDVKIVLDPVYGTIHLDFLARKIIDTPVFQRLRYIKQLSFADYVYPGAMHTRFAHSIGVYHLARQMIMKIEDKLPVGATKLSDVDKRCVRVAALCHDLGHGPFSHIYEQIGKDIMGMTIQHEDISKILMENILREDKDFQICFGDNFDDSIKLIKDLIKLPKGRILSDEEKLKKYMFQIVSNKDTGVDVDKWDYFNRDAIACGVPERFQYDRALSVSRVVKNAKEGTFELAYRDYDAFNLYNMFNTRLTMFRKVYKHKAVVAVDLMMKDAFQMMVGNHESQSETIDLFPVRTFKDLEDNEKIKAFLKLNDSVMFKIQEQNQAAAGVIDRIHKRNLYKMVIDILIPKEDKKPNEKEEEIPEDKEPKGKKQEIPEDKKPKGKKQEVDEEIKRLAAKYKYKTPDEIEIKEIIFDYGDKTNDPVAKLCFYKKGEEDSGYNIDRNKVSLMLPSLFQEVHLRVYYKKVEQVNKEFKKELEGLAKKMQGSQNGENAGKKERQSDEKEI